MNDNIAEKVVVITGANQPEGVDLGVDTNVIFFRPTNQELLT